MIQTWCQHVVKITWCVHGVHMMSTWCTHDVNVLLNHMMCTWFSHDAHMVWAVLVGRGSENFYMMRTWCISVYDTHMVCVWCPRGVVWHYEYFGGKLWFVIHDAYMMCNVTWCTHDVNESVKPHDVYMVFTWWDHVNHLGHVPLWEVTVKR